MSICSVVPTPTSP